MKVSTKLFKVVGNMSGIESTVKAFRLDKKPLRTIKVDDNRATNPVYHLTEEEYQEWFKEYYGNQFGGFIPPACCDICGKEMDTKIGSTLITHNIGSDWLEPRYCVCENCNNRMK